MATAVGVIVFELHIPAARSLKDKRRVVKGLKDRLAGKLSISVAETDFHDLTQRAELSVALVSHGFDDLERHMARVRDIVDHCHEAVVTVWSPQQLGADAEGPEWPLDPTPYPGGGGDRGHRP